MQEEEEAEFMTLEDARHATDVSVSLAQNQEKDLLIDP